MTAKKALSNSAKAGKPAEKKSTLKAKLGTAKSNTTKSSPVKPVKSGRVKKENTVAPAPEQAAAEESPHRVIISGITAKDIASNMELVKFFKHVDLLCHDLRKKIQEIARKHGLTVQEALHLTFLKGE